ncbi:MAG: phosphohistidine phosphatase [Chlorobiaceae bacterium]|nr:phosphohistidine phosphatase [Chlorobiaceae bacterium]
MKTIYLVRHANAGWSNANLPDVERTLSGQGRLEAGEVAARLAEKGARPEIIISSPAVRTLETAEIFGEVIGFGTDLVTEEPEIYSGDVAMMVGIVAKLPQECESIMLFGHNPTISMYGSWLSGKTLGQMDTCGVLRLDLPVKHWSDAKQGRASTAWYLCPKRRQ